MPEECDINKERQGEKRIGVSKGPGFYTRTVTVEMGVKLGLVCILAVVASARAQGWSAICQRFPNNPNCGGSSTSTNTKPVDPNSLGLPPPPSQPQPGQGSSQPAQLPSNNDPCTSWHSTYDKYCGGGNIPAEYQPSCTQYRQTCLGIQAPSSTPNNDPCSSWRPVYDKYCAPGNINQQYQQSCAQFQQTCLSGGGGLQSVGSQTQPPTQGTGSGSGIGSRWAQLTQKAQDEQRAQQALAAAQNNQPNCGQYQDNFNVWCGGAQQINALYCSTLGRMCQQQAAQTAAGQQTNFGPFSSSNGLPTGGAGSTRPLTIGNQFGVGPFFGMGKTLGINPLQGVGTNQGVNVPIAGIGIQRTSGVDWGGLPGVAQLGAALGGRRRRWAIPLGVDNFGNVIYF